jgi:hypothetical protein
MPVLCVCEGGSGENKKKIGFQVEKVQDRKKVLEGMR